MSDVKPGAPVLLRYCPICHQLIRPRMLLSNEAVEREDGCYHMACLAKGPVTAAPRNAAAEALFENETDPADLPQPSEKLQVQPATAIVGRKPSGGFENDLARMPKRKTTASVTSLPTRSDEPPAAPHRRPMAASHSHGPARKNSSAPLVFAALAALVLVAVGAYFLLNNHPADQPTPRGTTQVQPTPKPHVSGPVALTPSTPPSPPTPASSNARSPTPPTPPADIGAPPPPPTATVDTGPSPYELAQRNKLMAPPVVPGITYEPAGPAVSWFDGTTLGDWKLFKGNAGAVAVKDGVIEINPGDTVALFEHPVPTPDFDLSFEFRLGPNDHGAYAELWLQSGAVRFDGANFQSDNWTPVRVSVRNGKLTASSGTKGPDNMHPTGMDNGPATGDRAANLGDRQAVLFSLSVDDPKYLRNIQYTPMRPVAAPPAPAPTPVTATDPAQSGFQQPWVFKGDALEQPLGKWARAQVLTEDGKRFIEWSEAANKGLTLFADCNPANRAMPTALHVRLECRVRNTAERKIRIRTYGPNNQTYDAEAMLTAADTWQTLDMDLTGLTQTMDQFEIRLPSNPGEDARIDVASVTFSLPAK